uniref:Uncharacterized protein n=1 Tax=Anguilla anguilla TaxID=7936 RepID=A0A0E9RBJ2_ANGAN
MNRMLMHCAFFISFGIIVAYGTGEVNVVLTGCSFQMKAGVNFSSISHLSKTGACWRAVPYVLTECVSGQCPFQI